MTKDKSDEVRIYPEFTKVVRLSSKHEWYTYLGCRPHPIIDGGTFEDHDGVITVHTRPRLDENGRQVYTPAFQVKLFDEQKQIPYCTKQQCWCGGVATHDDGQCSYHGAPWKGFVFKDK